jgi:hypothetical protein
MHGCDSWSHIHERTQRNAAEMSILTSDRRIKEDGENYMIRGFMTSTLDQK